MSDVKVKVRLYRPVIYRVQADTADQVAGKAAQHIQSRARRFAPKDTGALAASIFVVKVSGGVKTTYKVGTDLHYARYQEKGTGPIFAKPGGVLRFKAGGKIIFAKSTRGVPATHFMRRAAIGVQVADFLT